MSNFPNKIDDDTTLPPVYNNITEIGGDAINSLREAVFNIEEEIGIGASGTLSSIAQRISVSIDPDGYIKPSSILLSSLFPIHDDQIASKGPGYGGITEDKLHLDYSTASLYEFYADLKTRTMSNEGWIGNFGAKTYKHVFQNEYNHVLENILISSPTFKNRFRLDNPSDPASNGSQFRNTENLYKLITDLNNDYVIHQKMDGKEISAVRSVITLSGNNYPSNFAHHGAGIYIDSSNYNIIPTTVDSVQKFADYVDANSMMLIGSRVQSLFTSGISRTSRSSSLTNDGNGINVIPETNATCYLSDVDDPSIGYDIIKLNPTDDQLGDLFASKFSLIKPGDIATVSYTRFGSPENKSVGSTPIASSASPDESKAYIVNNKSNDVSVVSLGSNLPTQLIGVGEGPSSIAVSSELNKAVVTNYTSKDATVIDLATNATVTVSCGNGPKHVAITRDGLRAIVANYDSNSVTFINLETSSKIIDLTCGINPVHVAVSQDGVTAAVVNKASSNVTFINLDTYQIIATINCGSSISPVSGEFNSTNTYFVTVNESSGTSTLIKLTNSEPSANTVSISCGASPSSIAITPSGKRAVITNYGGSTVTVIDLDVQKAFASINCDGKPYSVSISYDSSRAFVTCEETSKLNVINLETNKVIAKLDIGLGPSSVSVTSDKAIVSNSKSNDVNVININDIGVFETQFTVKEKKSVWKDTDIQYSIRVDGKNLFASESATVKIDKSLFNINKGGVLAVTAANSGLIISQPRGAVAIGNGFNPSQLSSGCYNLYLVLYPDGNYTESPILLKAIDVTGNKGSTPGSYTLESVVEETNKKLRSFNYRFVAFAYNGQFGIMLADSYRNASFSIVAGYLNTSTGEYENSSKYSSNIISHYQGNIARDPLGFSISGSNVASTNPIDIIGTLTPTIAYKFPTKIFYPLKRNNFYVDGAGTEIDRFAAEPEQNTDEYGNGYWVAQLDYVGSSSPQSFDFKYKINKNLISSGLKKGKTAVVQPINYAGVPDNFGRFLIKEIEFQENYTIITFDKAIVGSSTLPNGSANANDGYYYAIYFNSDSVAFNKTSASEDANESSDLNFKKHFEVFINKSGKSFSSERARLLTDGYCNANSGATLQSDIELSNVDIVRVSPKLRGFSYGTVNKISLRITEYNSTTGNFSGYLCDSGADSQSNLNQGPTSYGKNGEVVRFYDNTGVDYIDFKFNFNASSISNKKLSIQVFPSLSLDDELLPIASCQLNTRTSYVNNIVDLRQFGNISEKDISSSLINYIDAPTRLINSNGVINGFKALLDTSNGVVRVLVGGTALVNGKFIQLGTETINIPPVNEIDSDDERNPILWAICANDVGQYELIALCDSFEGGLNTGSRNIVARNINSENETNNFNLNSILFKKLINDSKNLTPLFLLKANVSKDSGTVYYTGSEINDVRRFISNEPLNNEFTWSSPSSELTSYFKNFESVKNWVNYYGDTSNTIKIRGTVTIDSYSNDFSKFNRAVNFEGDGSAARFDISTQTFDLGQNITYKNLSFKFTSGTYCTIYQSGSSGYCTFENVEFLSSSSNEYLNVNSLSAYNNFKNCLFSSTIKRFYLTSNCTFENVTFNRLYSSSEDDQFNLITLKNYNSFINCKFLDLTIDGAIGDGYVLTYDETNGNNNLFENCSFGNVASKRSGINIRNNNIFVNCKVFSSNSNGYNYINGTFLSLGSGNIVENLMFLADAASTSTYSSVIQQSSDENYSVIKIQNNNILKNIKAENFVANSSDGYAINIDGSGNIIDSLFLNAIVAPLSSIVINSTNNKILNSKFSCLSKSGIYFGTAIGSSSVDTVIDKNKITYVYTGQEIGDEENLNYIRASGGGLIFVNKSIKNLSITNCIFDKKPFGDPIYCSYTGDFLGYNQVSVGNFPPIISFYTDSADSYADFINIDKCRFVGVKDQNIYYPAIAFISGSDGYALALNNINITNNSSTLDSGLIIAGKQGAEKITARNVNICNNNFNYISAYSAPYVQGSNILIDGNTVYAILSLNYKATGLISNLSSTGDIIISNNSTQIINIYTAGN